MQLTFSRLAAAAAVLALAAGEHAASGGGEVTVRGAYYKERSTRVTQPMMDARFDVGQHGELDAHVLLDSISSASVAAGAAGQAFNENRFEAGASYLHRFGALRFGGGSRLSSESDYQSALVHLRGEMELADRNTILGLNLAGGRDSVSNAGAQTDISQPIEGVLYTSLASLSVTQVLGPDLMGQLTYDIAHLDGFQENPYRSVAAGGGLEPERVPDTRTRHAVEAALRGFVPRTRSTLIGSYRFYVDDWGVVGHTPELRVVQELTPEIDVHLRYRLHHQSAADFYKSIYESADPAVEPFLTDDAKLGRLTTHTVGGKLEVALSLFGIDSGFLNGARAQVGFEYIDQSTYYGNAVAAQLALSVPFEY
ncbi:MAG TPA: DUF3570 domain-containing protein [Kofleriaceae bacterium]|nr:DUF3570 domain-containing protein [Kofleriaceae bacterium]